MNEGNLRLGWNWKQVPPVPGHDVFRAAIGKPLKAAPKWAKKAWEKVRHMDILE